MPLNNFLLPFLIKLLSQDFKPGSQKIIIVGKNCRRLHVKKLFENDEILRGNNFIRIRICNRLLNKLPLFLSRKIGKYEIFINWLVIIVINSQKMLIPR